MSSSLTFSSSSSFVYTEDNQTILHHSNERKWGIAFLNLPERDEHEWFFEVVYSGEDPMQLIIGFIEERQWIGILQSSLSYRTVKLQCISWK